MASNINSSLALVTSSRRNYYDVFVTFRGEDTRNNFTDFLFDALETKGICVFRDDSLQTGESIGPELLRAIEVSKVFVVVFSRNYASSTWCLRELEKIRVHGSEKRVLPIFYDVDPSEVRKQSGIYHEDFLKHEKRFQENFEMVSRWREALEQVASISGCDLRDKPQAGAIKKIVQKIINILEFKSSCISKDLVGIDSPIQTLQNHLLLHSFDGVRAIGICGMGGIGKTTLAMILYGRISHQFSASCFIDDVSKIYRLHDGPLDAQKQILFQTLSIEHHQICNLYSATDLIRRRLRHEKALLILDNVDQVEQLKKIAVHREWLGVGSRIVIISRDEHILKEYGVDLVYKVPLLNRTDSYELFCRKAFKVEKIIMSNYQNLANEILNYAKDLPLAITVIGSFLFGRNVTEWKSALDRLRESPDNDVMDVLQLSFDGLMKTEKEIFLDIACFFNDWHEENVKNILNCCGFHADIGLSVLIDKSLISISDSRINMHSLLEQLGRKIVQENSSTEQRKWSRVWFEEQLYNVRMENMENHVEAIVWDYGDDLDLEALSKMSNLRLLIIRYGKYISDGNISGSPPKWNFSNKLRYVQWAEYPFNYLPSNFHPNELVELILKGSSLKQLWKNKKYLPNLRRLDLSDSAELEKIIDFGEFPNLERLNLKGCINLVELDPSIGLLRKLAYLNLIGCKNLVCIPTNIFRLSSLEDLNMHGCSKAFNNGPTSSVFKYLLPIIPTRNTYLLPSLHSLYCLREVDISYCHLSHLPDSIECLHWLERLNLRGNNFVTLPSLRKLSKLEYLNLDCCKLLESLPQLPFSITIRWVHRENNERWGAGLIIFNCPKLGERECYSSMTFSWMMKFIQAYQQSFSVYFHNTQIVTPGSEIPSWINNQSMGVFSNMEPVRGCLPSSDNCIGLVCCVVFSVEPDRACLRSSYNTNLTLFGECSEGVFTFDVPVNFNLVTTKSSHLWIIYLPREFGGDRDVRFQICGGSDLGFKVKSSGYRWVCKQELQEFNLTMMNHENSLARKCKILAIKDEEGVGASSLAGSSTTVADDGSVTENGVDQIVAEDEQQSQIDNGKEEVSAVTPKGSDGVITESEDDNVEAVPDNNEIGASLRGQSDDLSHMGSVNKDVTEEVQQEQTPVAAQVEEVAIASETNSISNSNEQTESSSEGFNFSRPMIILLLSLPVLKLLGMWVRR